MSIDQRGGQAGRQLREQLADDLPSARMLEAVRRTRARRRMALASSAVVAAVAVAALATTVPRHDAAEPAVPGPSSPMRTAAPAAHANGAVFGYGTHRLLHPAGLHVPPLAVSSSVTWAPDGSEVAVLAGGILITDVHTGRTRSLPCPGCLEIAWSPDGRTIAAATAGNGDSALHLIDATTGQARAIPLPGIERVRSITWGPDSQELGFLVVSPVADQGVWTVGVDGAPPQHVLGQSTGPLRVGSTDPYLLAIDWSPTSPSIAMLYAWYDHGQKTFRLTAWTMHPDSAAQNYLISMGTCGCAGWAPNLVWSPDGRTLLLSSLHRRPAVNRIDGDGLPVHVRFAAGASGPLTWQPLPRSN